MVAIAMLSGCATGQSSLMMSDFEETRDSVRVLMMEPDVSMFFFTTGGQEMRADWTERATENLSSALRTELENSGETVIQFVASEGGTEEIRQLLLLNEAVTQTVRDHVGIAGANVIPSPLPHRAARRLDYTLGAQATELADAFDADYAAFLVSRAQFESSGVFMRSVFVGTLTGFVPASQRFRGTYVSLVDLKSGDVVWVNGRTVGDPRDPEEAADIAAAIMESSPLN
ncbi:MAG: hypothetical protein AAFX03_10835 [Pseudomonadota bacterium]